MLIALSAVFGSIIGSFLNVVVYRLPRGLSVVRPRSACGSCGHEIRAWDNIPLVSWVLLRGRCRDCGAAISIRYPLIELAGALFFAAVAARFVPVFGAAVTTPSALAVMLQLVAFLYLAAISLALAIIDVEAHRLPNTIVLPAYLVGGAVLTGSAVLSGTWASLATAGIGCVAAAALYLILALVRPGGMGMGDVKLAGVLGLFLGWLGWAPLAVGIVAGFILGGVYGCVLLLRGRGRKAAIAFGPWMLAGAWIGILAGALVASGYLRLFGVEL